jgi:hypothetical protein
LKSDRLLQTTLGESGEAALSSQLSAKDSQTAQQMEELSRIRTQLDAQSQQVRRGNEK